MWLAPRLSAAALRGSWPVDRALDNGRAWWLSSGLIGRVIMRIILVLAVVLVSCTTAQTPSLPDGNNRVVDIVNTSDFAMKFTAINAERRGLNRLPSAAGEVAAQYYLSLNFDDESGACLFNLSAEFANGQSAQARQFNVCREVSWVVAP